MEQDQSTLVLRRFSEHLHGATVLTLHRDSARQGSAFGLDVVEHLSAGGMLGHVLWSTSCSPTQVTAAGCQRLRDAGLYLVRLELDRRTRHREVATAVQTLRRLGVLIECDLDLFGGSPRFATIRENLALLRAVGADGTVPASVRFTSTDDACSPWLQAYRRCLADAVAPWLGVAGLSVQLAEAWAELAVAERLALDLTSVAAHRIALQRLTLRCNTDLLKLVAASAADYEAAGATQRLDESRIRPRCAELAARLLALRNNLLVGDGPALVAVRLTG